MSDGAPSTRRHRLSAVVGSAIVLVLACTALAAPWLAPHDPNAQVDPAVAASRPPFSSLLEVSLDDGTRMLAIEVVREGELLRLDRGATSREVPASRVERIASRRYPLGTDRLGRDVLSRIVYGARTSLLVGVLAAGLALGVGVLVGSIAAMGSRLLDELLMRTVDGLLAFPPLLIVLALALFFEPGTTALIVIIGGTGWMGLSRLVRGDLLTVLSRLYVLAARGIGVGPLRLLGRHLLPDVWPTIVVAGCLLVGDAILVESAIAFLGLGVASDLPSWGRMVAHARADVLSLWWMSTFPGVCILLTVLGFNLIGDGLRDAFDPRLSWLGARGRLLGSRRARSRSTEQEARYR